jgi:hypothetical protein
MRAPDVQSDFACAGRGSSDTRCVTAFTRSRIALPRKRPRARSQKMAELRAPPPSGRRRRTAPIPRIQLAWPPDAGLEGLSVSVVGVVRRRA